MKKENKKIIEEILNSIPEEFRVIEQKIKDSKYKEYHEIDSKLVGLYVSKEVLIEANQWNRNTDSKVTKSLLVKLSQLSDVNSYRKIEQIINETEKEDIKEFGQICLMQSRLFLENLLLDEPVGMVSSGLGGKGNRLRYNIVLKSENEFSEERLNKLKEIINQICSKRDSELETIENLGKYVRIMLLVSMDEAIGIVIKDITDRLLFVDKEYICTNVEIIEKELIERWMNSELDE